MTNYCSAHGWKKVEKLFLRSCSIPGSPSFPPFFLPFSPDEIVLLSSSFLALALTVSAFASPLTWEDRHTLYRRQNESNANPVIDLGRAGKWQGVLQNNGTVESWKGIAYAQVGLSVTNCLHSTGNSRLWVYLDTKDVSDNALRCIQFPYGSASNVIGVKAGPGVEDCLKLWIWKPKSAKKGDNLPVMVYTHGGGLQYSAAPNNDFSDWVSQDQNFIAINPAYRLGGLGFMASEELTDEGESSNAGLLDQRAAIEWIAQHVSEFGGNPNDITIMGQSGGGYALAAQLALYDGKGTKFQKAIPRSVQRSTMWTTAELKGRNDQYAQLLNCTEGQSQLACFRNQTAEALVNAATTLNTMNRPNSNLTWANSAGFVPVIDGVTLTDHLTALFQAGKFAKKPLLVGYVNDELANGAPRNVTQITADNVNLYNVTAYAEEIISHYPVNATFGTVTNTGSFFLDTFRAILSGLGPFGDSGITGSERLMAKAFSQYADKAATWSFRFNAPTVGTSGRNGAAFPLNYVPHSADNSYLQNATSIMTPEERALALEWRAYIGSFIRTGNPNTQALKSAPTWYPYATLDYEKQPLRLVPAFHFSSSPDKNATTSSQMEVAGRPQLERIDYFLQPDLQAALRN